MKKLLLGFVLLLQFGMFSFVDAKVYNEAEKKQSEADQTYLKNPDKFDYKNADEAKSKGNVSSDAYNLAQGQKAIDVKNKKIEKETDPNTKAELKKERNAQQTELNKKMADYQKKDPDAGKVAEQSLGLCVPAPGHYCVKIDSFKKGGEVISGDNGIDLVKNYIKVIYKVAAGIIGVIAVLIIVISGIQISIGGLSPEGVNQARDRILQALLSLALLFGTALILTTVNPGFFV